MVSKATEVAVATATELRTWIRNKCFEICELKKSSDVMTSRCVAKWKFVKDPNSGLMAKTIRMRLALRVFMDVEAFDLDTFSGTAKRQAQHILASESACRPEWKLASLDIDKDTLQGLTYKELAEATGEAERLVFHVTAWKRCHP